MPPKLPKRISKKHADGCICVKCLPKHAASKKPAVHLRFSSDSDPEPDDASACVKCKTDLRRYQDLCAECYGNRRRELETDILSLLFRAKLIQTPKEYCEIYNQQLAKFHSTFDALPFEPVALKYVLNQYFGNASQLGLKAKRSIMSKFSPLLKIQRGPDGKWICCKNRFDASDLNTYERILRRRPTPTTPNSKRSKRSPPPSQAVSEDDDVQTPIGDSSDEVPMDIDEDPAHAIVHNFSDIPGVSSPLKPARRDDTNESDESVEIGGISMPDAVSTSTSSDSDSDVECIIVPVIRKLPPVVVLDDSETDNGNAIDNHISSSSSGITPQTATASTEKVRQDSQTARPRSRCTVKKPKKIRVKKVPRRHNTRPDLEDSSEEDEDFVPPSSSSSSDSYDSDASSVIRSSDDDTNKSEEAEDESDFEGSDRSRSRNNDTIQPTDTPETLAESRAKDTAKKVANDAWRKLERRREDYEDEVLWNVPFKKRPLSYAVKRITRKLGWNIFPFGAGMLNNGNMSWKQIQHPNGGTWLRIKEEFVKRHFKTALSITACRGKWYCCKSRVDILKYKAYLRKYWKIEVK